MNKHIVKATMQWCVGILLLISAGFVGYAFGRGQKDAPVTASVSPAVSPTARVTVAPLRQSVISETMTAYGTVIPRPGKAHSLSVLFEIVVRHVHVTPGESVVSGTVLADIEPSAGARLALAQANVEAEAASQEFTQTQERLSLNFATSQELGQVRKAMDTARVRLQSLKSEGIDLQRQITSPLTGLVGQVKVRDGQIIPAGTPLLEIVGRNDIDVRLGVEPEDVSYLREGGKLTLIPVHAAESKTFEGRIRVISQRINPDTHLVDVYVSPPEGAQLLMEASVKSEIAKASHTGLLVPRDAVLPRGDKEVLFTVRDGHAVEHVVQIGLKSGVDVEILGTVLHPGDPVVVQGNYELADGMAVEIARRP